MCYSDNSNGTAVLLNNDAHPDVVNSKTSNALKKKSSGYLIKEPTIGEKLFQAKEDRLYFHKIMGFSVLASYAYRFWHLGGKTDGNFVGIMPLIFVLHHASLNLSSFVFDIPKKRIMGGFRIWPEYRIHSMVFTFRNLACIVRLWFLLKTPKENTAVYSLWNDGLVNWMIVMATCAAADYGSSLSGQYKSDTVRGCDYFDPYANWFASEMQFQLTAVCLSGGYQRFSLHVVGAFIIQFNSFLMTLRRKNVFSHLTLTTTYGIMLIGSLFIGIHEDYYTNDALTKLSTFANVGVIMRMGFGVDKYVVWTVLALGMYLANQYLPPIVAQWPQHPYFYLAIVFWSTKFICFGLGLRKRARVLQQRKLAQSKDKAINKEAPPEVGNGVIIFAGVVFSILATYDILESLELI